MWLEQSHCSDEHGFDDHCFDDDCSDGYFSDDNHSNAYHPFYFGATAATVSDFFSSSGFISSDSLPLCKL